MFLRLNRFNYDLRPPQTIPQVGSDARYQVRSHSYPALALLLVAAFVSLGQRSCPAQVSGHKESLGLQDPRGPIAAWAGKTLVNTEGVQAVNFHFTPPAPNPWQPQWIWASSPNGPASSTRAAHFRKRFELPTEAQVTQAYAKVSADRIYRLWVNGHLVSRGPADAGHDELLFSHWSHQWLYNVVDIGPYLHGGSNEIAAEVLNLNSLSSFSLGSIGLEKRNMLVLSSPTHTLRVEAAPPPILHRFGVRSSRLPSNEVVPPLPETTRITAITNATRRSGIPILIVIRSGFAFGAAIDLTSGATISISSDTSWKTEVVNAYGEGPLDAISPKAPDKTPPSGLTFDARLEEPAWRSTQFDDSKWPMAKIIESSWGTLTASQIPEAMEAIYPAQSIENATSSLTSTAPFSELGHSIRLSGDATFSICYDRVMSGIVSMKVRAAAGTVVAVEPLETIDGHPFRPFQVTLREGETIFEYPSLDSFTVLRVTVSKASRPVEFSDIRATFVSQPVSYRGSFTSSDPNLNRLWTTARWLTQICMQDHYLDSPNHQEPIGDFGDYLIESLENDYAFNEPWLARQDMRKFAGVLDNANSVNFHTSYSLLWLQMLMDYYDYTGDDSLLHELKPTVDRLLDHYATFVGKDGLLSEAPNYMFMDWVTIDGFQTHHPPAVIGTGYLTAFYYRGLADGARLARLTGDSAREARYNQQRIAVHEAFEKELWDQDAGLYRDGIPFHNHQHDPDWLPADRNIATHSPHINALAVLYDLAPKARQEAIMGSIFSTRPLNVQPYFMHFIFAAEEHAGDFNIYAWTQMQRWHLNLETKTFNEDWYGGDWSHAWGGTPLIQMSARILGVTPASTGYKTVAIHPELCGLHFAKGVVPTPQGDVTISWSQNDSDFTLDFTVPTDTEVTLPETNGTMGQLTVDGKFSGNPYHAGMQLTLPRGEHHITISAKKVWLRR